MYSTNSNLLKTHRSSVSLPAMTASGCSPGYSGDRSPDREGEGQRGRWPSVVVTLCCGTTIITMMVVYIVILITQTTNEGILTEGGDHPRTTEGNLLGIILDNIPDEGNLLGIIPEPLRGTFRGSSPTSSPRRGSSQTSSPRRGSFLRLQSVGRRCSGGLCV